jgi:hypothetical protein
LLFQSVKRTTRAPTKGRDQNQIRSITPGIPQYPAMSVAVARGSNEIDTFHSIDSHRDLVEI